MVLTDEALADDTGANDGGGNRNHTDAEDEGEGVLFGASEAHGADDEQGDDQNCSMKVSMCKYYDQDRGLRGTEC